MNLQLRTPLLLVIAAIAGEIAQAVLPVLLGGGILGTVAGIGTTIVLVAIAAVIVVNMDLNLINAIRDAVTKIEHNDVPVPVETDRTDELGELAQSINRLTKRDKAVEQANTDALTNLANRRGLLQKLTAAFNRKETLALFYIDLDKFKPINDTHGHEAGDAVLKKVADLLTACVREKDTVARMGGDEFVVVMYELTDRKLLEERAKRMLEALSEPMWVGDVRVKIGGSIGITIAPTDGETVESLMHAADETMYAVKKAGRNNWKFYS